MFKIYIFGKHKVKVKRIRIKISESLDQDNHIMIFDYLPVKPRQNLEINYFYRKTPYLVPSTILDFFEGTKFSSQFFEEILGLEMVYFEPREMPKKYL
jgi:hypothetical protein